MVQNAAAGRFQFIVARFCMALVGFVASVGTHGPITYLLSKRDRVKLVQVAVNFSLALAFEISVGRSCYKFNPPFAFVGLLCVDPDKRAATLQYASRLYDKMVQLDELCMNGDKDAIAWKKETPWLSMTWPRELLVHLAGVKFRNVPKHTVEEPLHYWSQGFDHRGDGRS